MQNVRYINLEIEKKIKYKAFQAFTEKFSEPTMHRNPEKDFETKGKQKLKENWKVKDDLQLKVQQVAKGYQDTNSIKELQLNQDQEIKLKYKVNKKLDANITPNKGEIQNDDMKNMENSELTGKLDIHKEQNDDMKDKEDIEHTEKIEIYEYLPFKQNSISKLGNKLINVNASVKDLKQEQKPGKNHTKNVPSSSDVVTSGDSQQHADDKDAKFTFITLKTSDNTLLGGVNVTYVYGGKNLTTVTTDDSGTAEVHLPVREMGINDSLNDFLVNFSIPAQLLMPEPNKSQDFIYKMILTWGDKPKDLDLVSLKFMQNKTNCSINYMHKDECDGVVLLRDNMIGGDKGSETITWNNQNDKYKYLLYVESESLKPGEFVSSQVNIFS